jgi:hypothetical protein
VCGNFEMVPGRHTYTDARMYGPPHTHLFSTLILTITLHHGAMSQPYLLRRVVVGVQLCLIDTILLWMDVQGSSCDTYAMRAKLLHFQSALD